MLGSSPNSHVESGVPALGSRTNWKSVIVFYLIACAFSWPFFAWRDLFPDSWDNSSVPSAIRNLGVMWGPGVAAIICFFLFRKTHVRTITFTGTSILKSVLFFGLPYAIWTLLLFINPSEDTIEPTYLLQLIPFGFLMILGEELGWRGFLQDALRPLPEWKRWVVLGILWEFWHFTRGMVHGELFQIIVRKSVMLISVLILTYIIGKLTDKTKSLFIAITLHSWVNLQFEFAHINTQIAGVLSVIVWTVLIWQWNKGRKGATELVSAEQASTVA